MNKLYKGKITKECVICLKPINMIGKSKLLSCAHRMYNVYILNLKAFDN